MIPDCSRCDRTWDELRAVPGHAHIRLCRDCGHTVHVVSSYEAERDLRQQGLRIVRTPAYESEHRFMNEPIVSVHRLQPVEYLDLPESLVLLLKRHNVFHIEVLALHRRSELRAFGVSASELTQIDLALRAKGFVLDARARFDPPPRRCTSA